MRRREPTRIRPLLTVLTKTLLRKDRSQARIMSNPDTGRNISECSRSPATKGSRTVAAVADSVPHGGLNSNVNSVFFVFALTGLSLFFQFFFCFSNSIHYSTFTPPQVQVQCSQRVPGYNLPAFPLQSFCRVLKVL